MYGVFMPPYIALYFAEVHVSSLGERTISKSACSVCKAWLVLGCVEATAVAMLCTLLNQTLIYPLFFVTIFKYQSPT